MSTLFKTRYNFERQCHDFKRSTLRCLLHMCHISLLVLTGFVGTSSEDLFGRSPWRGFESRVPYCPKEEYPPSMLKSTQVPEVHDPSKSVLTVGLRFRSHGPWFIGRTLGGGALSHRKGTMDYSSLLVSTYLGRDTCVCGPNGEGLNCRLLSCKGRGRLEPGGSREKGVIPDKELGWIDCSVLNRTRYSVSSEISLGGTFCL